MGISGERNFTDKGVNLHGDQVAQRAGVADGKAGGQIHYDGDKGFQHRCLLLMGLREMPSPSGRRAADLGRGLGHPFLDFAQLEGLGDEVKDALLEGLLGGLQSGKAGDDEDFRH